MLTGDQLNTGRAIARELGLGTGEPHAVQARDLVGIDQQHLAELARTQTFLRVFLPKTNCESSKHYNKQMKSSR